MPRFRHLQLSNKTHDAVFNFPPKCAEYTEDRQTFNLENSLIPSINVCARQIIPKYRHNLLASYGGFAYPISA
jgi:hypothetical protein